MAKPPRPFTVEHFRAWARGLTLDNGKPWVLEPFQAAFIRDLFRGYVESWLVIPEGNAKTTLAGALVLYHIQHREGARVVVAASSRDQAEWLYQAAAGFVQRSGLTMFRCQEGYRRIRCDSMSSRIQIFAADDRTGDGANFTLAVLEELHRHRDLRLYRTWRGKCEKQGGQLVAISTAGAPESEFEQVRERMKDGAELTRRGAFTRAVSRTTVIHEYALPEGKDPDNMRDVKTCNPLRAITTRMLRDKHDSPAMIPSHWRRFVCGVPAAIGAAISPEQWDPLRVDIGGVADGEAVWTAIRVFQGGCGVGIAAPRADGSVAIRCETLPYDWPGLQAALRRMTDRYDVRAIYVDRRQLGIGTSVLEETGLPLEEIPQTVTRWMESTATFLGLLSAGKLMHDGDKTLRAEVLAVRMKETLTGGHFDITDETRTLGAVLIATHGALVHQGDRAPRIHTYRGA